MNRRLSIWAAALALGIATGCGRDLLHSGIHALESGDTARAERLLAQATQVQPDDASAWANLGIARLKLGHVDNAITAFRQAAELDHDDARPLEYVASIQADRGQWKPALDTLNEAVRRDPKSPRLLTALAAAEWHIYGPQTARSRLIDVLTMAPNYSPAIFNLAVVQRDGLHNPAEAAALFQRFLKLAPSDPHAPEARAALASTGQEPPPVLVAHAGGGPASGRPTATRSTAGTAQPPVSRNPQAAAEAYNRGIHSQAAGDLDRALQEYGRALQYDPTMASAQFNLGLTHAAKGDTPSAQAAFLKALELAPDMVNARYMLALGYRDQGDTGRAIAELNTVIKQQPQHAEAHLTLGLIYKKDAAKVALARQELTRYLELAPGGASAKDVRNWLKYQH